MLEYKPMDGIYITLPDSAPFTLAEPPPPSEWKCYLFGGDHYGMVFYPRKGKHPNWFWRKMQFLCFGNRWVRESK